VSNAGAWWDEYTKQLGGVENLETWLGGVDEWSRIRVRERVAECQYESVLDCGAGLGLDWYGFSNLSHDANWRGIEPSSGMRRSAMQMMGSFGRTTPPPIEDGEITAIPFGDGEIECVYCRHVLEHLPSFEAALTEMLRVAKLEVMVVFFMRPGRDAYLTRERDGLWQNRYAKVDVEDLLAQNPRALCWFWEPLHGQEVILHVMMADAAQVERERVVGRLKRD
jgi:ubiquinone/menaquinone biosynthesis C-methylase UbiE